MKISDLMKILIVLTTVLLIVDGGFRIRNRGKKRRKYLRNPNYFDFLIFTQRWPPSVCYAWKDKYPSHTCLLPTNEEWTIHGIWPTQMGKEGPMYCNNASIFEENSLLPIKSELEKKWINIENGTGDFSFWKHEWDKHGTCVQSLNVVNTEFKYFSKGLELLNKYDMTYTLAKANILPNNNYKVQQILDGVKKVLGKTCQVECIVNPKTHDHYIFEIRICFDKSFQLIDCNGIVNYPTNCPRKKSLTYPANVPDIISVIQI